MLASLRLPHARDYLNMLPNPALGLHLRAPELVAELWYRLGVNVYQICEEVEPGRRTSRRPTSAGCGRRTGGWCRWSRM